LHVLLIFRCLLLKDSWSLPPFHSFPKDPKLSWLGRLRKEDREFKASLGYTEKFFFKEPK
jgi:hypothetical protein